MRSKKRVRSSTSPVQRTISTDSAFTSQVEEDRRLPMVSSPKVHLELSSPLRIRSSSSRHLATPLVDRGNEGMARSGHTSHKNDKTLHFDAASCLVGTLNDNTPYRGTSLENRILRDAVLRLEPSSLVSSTVDPEHLLTLLPNALAWFSKPPPSSQTSHATLNCYRKRIPKDRRLHSLEALLLACGWSANGLDGMNPAAGCGMIFLCGEDGAGRAAVGDKMMSFGGGVISYPRSPIYIISLGNGLVPDIILFE